MFGEIRMVESEDYNEEQVNIDEDSCLESLVSEIEEQLECANDNVAEADKMHYIASEVVLSTEVNVNHTALENGKDNANPIDHDTEKHAALLAYPPHGCEVFIAGLPKHVSDMDLDKLCESIGEISEVRLVKNKNTGEAKGYAFVSYARKEDAKKAVEFLHNQKFMEKYLRCSLSESKNKLFIGNIPKSLTEDEFRNIIEGIGPGSEIIDLVKDPHKPGCNRGFGFVEYYNSACAEYAKQKMRSTDFQLDGSTLSVSWADNRSMHDISATAQAQVKALYVKNIPDDTTTEKLKELFQRHGEVTKVVMPLPKFGDNNKQNFGFVYFAERSSALKAVMESEIYAIKGKLLEVALAKPQSDRKSTDHQSRHRNNFGALSYGSARADYVISSKFRQPMVYGEGEAREGMQMTPMVVDNGQIGYVLKQSGVETRNRRPRQYAERYDHSDRHRRRRSDRQDDEDYYDSHRSRRHRPY